MTKYQSSNLLPASRSKALAYEYFTRLGVVALAMMIVITLVAALLLVPTHVYLTDSLHIKQRSLSDLDTTSTPQGSDISARKSALASRLSVLASLAEASSASKTVRQALSVSRPGIALTSINYTAGVTPKANTLLLSGTAATRDALHAYQLALQEAPFVRAAEVPVAAFAKDVKIPFTVTVTLTP